MQAVKHKDKAIEIKHAKSTWNVLSLANGAYFSPRDMDTTEGWDELEKAVRYTCIGKYEDAKKIFSRQFIGFAPHKYVEACVLYRTIGEWRTFVKDIPPLVPPRVLGSKIPDADIWGLMTLLSYHANIIANGTLRQPLQFVKSFYTRHLKKDIQDFTGIDVSVVNTKLIHTFEP